MRLKARLKLTNKNNYDYIIELQKLRGNPRIIQILLWIPTNIGSLVKFLFLVPLASLFLARTD